ncbi:MAG: hypothetical protein KDC83_07425 [Flavobacteriales bacterium]|nr:hypothetical protein [Flavobacteriales bacterium]
MEILAVLFFLIVVVGAFFTLVFLALFLPYWITIQVIDLIKHPSGGRGA